MLKSHLLAPLLVFALAACTVSVPSPETDVFACETDEDCASDYACHSTEAGKYCMKICSEDNDCPSSKPKCLDKWCVAEGTSGCTNNTCAAQGGKTCVVDAAGKAQCVFCGTTNNTCDNPDLVCVKRSATDIEGFCAPGCGTAVLTGVCGLPGGGSGKCVKVQTMSASVVKPACAVCGCANVANCNTVDSQPYGDATTCSCTASTAIADCGNSGLCVNQTCFTECSTAADCSGSSACVYALLPDGTTKNHVCKPCVSACQGVQVCTETNPNAAGSTPYSQLIVDCKTPSAGWQAPDAGNPASSLVDGSNNATSLAFILDGNGNPVVASTDPTSPIDVSIYNEQTGQWNTQGGPGPGVGDPALALGADGNIRLAWDHLDQGGTGTVNAYWEVLAGGGWAAEGSSGGQPSNSGTGLSNAVKTPCERPAITYVGNTPVAVWQSSENASLKGIRGKFLSTSQTWDDLGTNTNGSEPGFVTTGLAQSSLAPTPVLAATNSWLFAAWQMADGNVLVRMLVPVDGTGKWDDATTYLPAGSDSTGLVAASGRSFPANPSLTIDGSDYPIVAWLEKNANGKKGVRVSRVRDNSGWEWGNFCPTGDAWAFSSSTDEATNVAVAYYSKDRHSGGGVSRVIVAFTRGPNVFVRTAQGDCGDTAWSTFESGDATGSGLSGAESASLPKIAVYDYSPEPRVCVSWIVAGTGVKVVCHSLL